MERTSPSTAGSAPRANNAAVPSAVALPPSKQRKMRSSAAPTFMDFFE